MPVIYINKLVEHDGTKCLIIGNSEEIEVENKKKFQKTKEKTIGFIYRLHYHSDAVLKAAISLVSFPSEHCKKYIEDFLRVNRNRIFYTLDLAKCSNIRTVSTAIHYLVIIYSNNREKFELSPASAISYFISLLSTLILIVHYKNSDEDKEAILDPFADTDKLIEKAGIKFTDVNGSRKELSGEETIIWYLIHSAFHQSKEIKLKGKFSIIRYGFYRAEDFEDEFAEWKKTKNYEYYIDTFKFWYLSDREANQIVIVLRK